MPADQLAAVQLAETARPTATAIPAVPAANAKVRPVALARPATMAKTNVVENQTIAIPATATVTTTECVLCLHKPHPTTAELANVAHGGMLRPATINVEIKSCLTTCLAG